MTKLNLATLAAAAITSSMLFAVTTSAWAGDYRDWERKKWDHRHHHRHERVERVEHHYYEPPPRRVVYERQPVMMMPTTQSTMNPRSFTMPPQRACRMTAFQRTMRIAPFSFGSQPQNRPHD